MNITGGEVVAKMLQEEGVEKVFGIIDGTYFGFYSSLQKYGIELISPRHETSAVHMAGTYARMTGKLGVCMASNGPGVANALSGVAVEENEGNRVLLITSCRRVGISYPDRGGTFQYFDQVKTISGMSKQSTAVPSFDRIPEIVRQAFRRSFTGRPGVVHIDIPESIMNGKDKISDSEFFPKERYRRTEPIKPSHDLINDAAQMLVSADLPLIHAGTGVIHSGAFEELKNVAEVLQAPITTSWGGRSAIPETNPLVVPLSLVELNNEIRNEADLILTLGSRIGETDWWGKQPNWASPHEQKMIQVDLDDNFLGRNKPADLMIHSDIKTFLKLLHDQLLSMKRDIPREKRQEHFAKFQSMQEKMRAKLDEKLKDESVPMCTAHIPKLCQEIFEDDSICVLDGGNTAVWGQFYWEAKQPNTLATTFKFGMLGAGVGQAIGAAVARPDKQVYCIIGDGAMGFHCQEVETAVRNNLNICYIVVCDKQWGMVKMGQQIALKPLKTVIKKSLDESETINADFNEIQFDKLAESMGAYGVRVSSIAQLEDALKTVKKLGSVSVVHVDVDPVKHMWAPSLADFKKMHEEPKGK